MSEDKMLQGPDNIDALPVQKKISEIAYALEDRVDSATKRSKEIASQIEPRFNDLINEVNDYIKQGTHFGEKGDAPESRQVMSRFRILQLYFQDSDIEGALCFTFDCIEKIIVYGTMDEVWGEDVLSAVRGEVLFAREAIRIFTLALPKPIREFRDIAIYLGLMDDYLSRATYQGQLTELQRRISSNQLSLIEQQAKILDRFDRQGRQMERMNNWMNRFSIAAAIAAILALMLQALDVFHVIP